MTFDTTAFHDLGMAYRLRQYTRTDAANVVAMLNAGRANPRAAVDDAGNLRLIRYVPFSSSKVVVENEHGQIIGYAYLADKENCFVFETGGGVHPDWRNRGVGSLLTSWAEGEAQRLCQYAPVDVKCVLQVNIFESEIETLQFFAERDFSNVRTWAHYHIHFKDGLATPALSDGLTIRPFDLDRDEEWDLLSPVQEAAFVDHWGSYSLPATENAGLEENAEEEQEEEEIPLDFSFSNAPGYCFLASVGDKVAGGILCNARLVEFANTGRVGSLFVSPHYRRRGVGKNLMLTAFHAFWGNGMRRVILDTDSQSFTDSSLFYTSLGMSIYRKEFLYEKEIRSGKEIRRLTF